LNEAREIAERAFFYYGYKKNFPASCNRNSFRKGKIDCGRYTLEVRKSYS